MKYLFLPLLAGMFTFHTYGADNLRLPDVRCIGMGGNVGTQSILFNPALLASQERRSVRLEYFNRYMLKELGTFSGSFYYPNPLLSAGIDLSVFGFDDYRETMVRLSAAKSLNDRWALGVAFHYSFLQSTLLEQTQSRLSTDIGITFLPIDNLLIGMFVINLPSFSFGNDDIDVEDFDYYLAQISFQWEIINGLLITGSAGADSERTLIGNIGLEYAAFDSFFIRAGVQTSPLLPSIGLGYTLSGFTLDAAVVYHPVLGMSTGLGLSYTF